MVCWLTAAHARSGGLACDLCYTLEGKQAQDRHPQPAQRDIPVGEILLEQHTGSEKRTLPGFIICPGKRLELGQNSEYPLLWSFPVIQYFLSSDVP